MSSPFMKKIFCLYLDRIIAGREPIDKSGRIGYNISRIPARQFETEVQARYDSEVDYVYI